MNTNIMLAVDFDGTLYDDNPASYGVPRIDVINRLIAMQKKGTRLILWTCRNGSKLTEAVEWCKQYGLTFDCINEDAEEVKKMHYDKSSKLMVHYYLDSNNLNIKDFLEMTKDIGEVK